MKALAIAMLAACSGPTVDGTACSTDGDCNLFNVQGRCETTGFCSYPDSTCVDGSRYAPGAGDGLGGTCLGGELACGAQDVACCGVDTCGPDLACVDSVCRCGGAGQPCCGGSQCSGGLACGVGTCSDAAVTQVALGMGHGCALRADKTVWCWGYDFKRFPFSAPGIGVAVIGNPVPLPIAGLADAVELRAGGHHTCARKSDNTLACWGHNERGQLGDGTTTSSATPVAVGGLTNVTRFDAGQLHTCAVGSYLGTAGLWCWGRNGEKDHVPNPPAPNVNLGRLGNGLTADSSTPVAVDLSVAAAAGQTIKSLSAGAYHTCIVMSDNKVWCWGRNNTNQLGTGNTTDTKAPAEVNLAGVAIPNGVSIDEVSCGDSRRRQDSTCIRLSDGQIFCWGRGEEGELGDGSTATRATPTTPVTSAVFDGTPAQLAAGQDARCARTNTGNVACWGKNTNGVLGFGVGNFGNFTTPGAVPISNVVQLEMSHHTTCAVDDNMRLWCWGTNVRGQSRGRPAADQTEKATVEPFEITF